MQTYNPEGELLKSELINNLDSIDKAMAEPETGFVVVGHIPKIGYQFETSGLKFKVIMSNAKKGRFTAEIL